MPIDASITGTPLGAITGTVVNADDGTIQGTIGYVAVGTVSSTLGVPGPQGPAGSQGPAGPQGQQGNPGVGIPAGGTAGQILAKVDGVDYNTQWVNDSGAVVWGDITGTLSDQTDLQTALDAKLNWFGGSLVSGYLEGCQVVSTPPLADNTHAVADTAFVQQELASGTAVAKNLEVYVRNQTGATLTAGTIVYINGATGNRPTVTKAQANNDANSAQTLGFVKTAIADNGFGFVIVRGECENLDTSALTEGAQLYLSPTTAGTWTTTKPSAPQHLVYVGIVVRSHPTQGVILVAVQNGYELDELHDVQIVSPTNGQVLKYDSATGLWKNATDLNSGVWGSITGTLSSQTDLQTALDGKYSTSNPAGYITSSALSPYLLSSTAASTYYLQSNPAGYITSAALTPYLTIVDAESSFYPLTGNPSGFITSSALTGYATESWVTAGFYPLTGNPSGFLTSSALTPYLLSSTAASTYYPLTNPSGYITSAALSGYATESFVTSQGYITSSALSPYLTSATASATYLAKASNLSDLTSASTARTNLGLGTAAVEPATKLVPAGGTTGQVLAKSSNTDWDDAWITIPSAPVTSVAGRTGAVTLSTSDISGLGTMATATAADYSTTAVANGLYYPLSSNPSGYLTSASLSGYATESFVTSQGYITSSALTPYLTSATAASTYQTISGMSSYLTTSAAASTYLTQSNAATTYYPLSSNPAGYLTSAPVTSVAGKTGAVSLVVADVSGAAPLASPALSGVPTAPTAANGTNTTQIATTAFVLANAGSTSFATAADAVLQSSTTTALSPSVAPFAISNGLTTRLDYITTTGVSGSGAVTASLVGFREMYTNSTGTNGKATFTAGQIGLVSVFHNLTSEAQTNFSKKIWMSGRFLAYLNSTYVGDANGFVSISLGGYTTTTATGAMTVKGIGLRKLGGASSVIQLVVHNGTTQTLVNTSKTMGMMEIVEYLVYSDGAGNVQLYLNGSLAASSSAGPTGNTANFQNIYREQAEQTSSATSRHLLHCYGGQLITER